MQIHKIPFGFDLYLNKLTYRSKCLIFFGINNTAVRFYSACKFTELQDEIITGRPMASFNIETVATREVFIRGCSIDKIIVPPKYQEETLTSILMQDTWD